MFETSNRLSVLTENEKRELMLSLEEIAQIEGLRDYPASNSESAKYSELKIMMDSKAEKNDVIRHDGSVGLTNDWDAGYGSRIKIDEISARDSTGLKLCDDDGKGIFISDGGNIAVGNIIPTSKCHISQAGSVGDVALSVYDEIKSNEEFLIKKVSSSGYRIQGRGFSTIPAVDINGFQLLTSTNSAQFMCCKGLFVGLSYTSAGANAGEIRSQSDINIRLLPGGSTCMTLETSGVVKFHDDIEIYGDLNHDGASIGFFGKTPVGQRLKANYNNWASLPDVVQALVDIGIFDQV